MVLKRLLSRYGHYTRFSPNRTRLSASAVGVVFAVFSVIPTMAMAADEKSPTAVVEGFQGVLISVMKDADELGYQGRYDRLGPAIEDSHDLNAISQIALGGAWDKLTSAQKQLFVEKFSQLSIATYAFRFDSYNGQQFETLSNQKLENGDALVRSRLVAPSGEVNNFDYVLRDTGNGWRIINIIVNGISDLALKRAEYSSVIRRQGFEQLIAQLDEKIALYSKEGRK